jgi:hypothetical protein
VGAHQGPAGFPVELRHLVLAEAAGIAPRGALLDVVAHRLDILRIGAEREGRWNRSAEVDPEVAGISARRGGGVRGDVPRGGGSAFGRRPVSWSPEPPSLWYIQSCPVRVAMTYCPSEDQIGDAKLVRSLLVMMRVREPSALAIHRFFDPLRSLTNTIWRPSGEYRGC